MVCVAQDRLEWTLFTWWAPGVPLVPTLKLSDYNHGEGIHVSPCVLIKSVVI